MSVPILTRVDAGYTYAGETNLAVMTCPVCWITYAIPERLRSGAETRGHGVITWYCPNGHDLGFHGRSAAEQAEAEAELERSRAAHLRALLDQTDASLRAQKARATRFRNDRDRERRRAAHGVCPCCGRTFKQLARHMSSQHPDFIAHADAPGTE